jgi:thiol-disulfide isomerase/thioredoxin
MDSLLTRLKATFTLEDPHASDLQLFRDGRTYYATTSTGYLPYLRTNGLDSGEVYEFLAAFDKAIALGQKIKNAEVQTDSAIADIHPYFQPVLRAFNDSTRVLVERLKREAADRIMPTPDVAGDQLLQTIANQYPGKAVFFDLWATWCGPCKRGITAMEPLKEQLRDKDVVFVYLTDESSPLNEWNDYVLKIPGQHYRIPSSLWRELPNVSAIPQYFLYDRQGKQAWEQTGFGDSVLKDIESEIESILK